jgi:hypothetical protein
MLTALDGTKIKGDADDLQFRWDECEGIRIITFFTEENVVSMMTEVEHDALAIRSTITASMKTDHDVMFDSGWSRKLSAFSAAHAFRSPTVKALKSWNKLPSEIVETWAIALHLYAGFEMVRRHELLGSLPADYSASEDPIHDPALYACRTKAAGSLADPKPMGKDMKEAVK